MRWWLGVRKFLGKMGKRRLTTSNHTCNPHNHKQLRKIKPLRQKRDVKQEQLSRDAQKDLVMHRNSKDEEHDAQIDIVMHRNSKDEEQSAGRSNQVVDEEKTSQPGSDTKLMRGLAAMVSIVT